MKSFQSCTPFLFCIIMCGLKPNQIANEAQSVFISLLFGFGKWINRSEGTPNTPFP